MKQLTFPCGCKFKIDPVAPKIDGRGGVIFDPEDISLECEATWELIGKGFTKGVFQLESSGKQWAKRLKPENIEQLSALTALLRPGCLNAKDSRGVSMTELYCRRKNGEEPVEVNCEAVRSILEPTYDVLCIDQDALISMANGLQVPLRDVRRGDKLHSIDTKTRLACIDTCTAIGPTRREDGLKITLENGFSTIVTKDHEVLTYYGFKKAEDLVIESDLVGVAHGLPCDLPIGLDSWLGGDEDVAYLMGYIVGNGSISTGLALCTGSEWRADKLTEWINKRFPVLKIHKYFHTRAWYLGISCDELANEPGFGNRKKKFRRFLETSELVYPCKQKKIPDVVLRARKSVQYAFLAGLFDADGCGKDKACFISSSALKVQEGLMHLGRIHGLCPHLVPDSSQVHFFNSAKLKEVTAPYRLLRTIDHNGTGGVSYGRVPRVEIRDLWDKSGMTQKVFAAKHGISPLVFNKFSRMSIPAKSGTAAKVGITTGDLRFMRIRSIEIAPNRQFYGLNVKKNHNLIADGICLHNCFQEQMMQIAALVAAFDKMMVDKLRKAAGKKDQSLMASIGVVFVEQATKVGIITRQQAEELFANIQKSGRYLFNKSHAVGYSLTTYETAFLKAHFPLDFYTSYLYFAKEKQDPLMEVKELIYDAKMLGIKVLPPRFSGLRPHFSTDGIVITFGLADIKDVGEKQIPGMIAAANAAVASCGKQLHEWTWYDFLTLVSMEINSKAVGRLIESGAIDFGDLQRQRMLAEFKAWHTLTDRERSLIVSDLKDCTNVADAIGRLLDTPKAVSGKRRDKVDSIRMMLVNPPRSLTDSVDWVARTEQQNLGVSLTCSRTSRGDTSRVNATCKGYREGRGNDDYIVIAVTVEDIREITTKTGKNPGSKMAFITAADETGMLDDIVCFSDAWEVYSNDIFPGAPIMIQGKRDFKKGSLIVEQVWKI